MGRVGGREKRGKEGGREQRREGGREGAGWEREGWWGGRAEQRGSEGERKGGREGEEMEGWCLMLYFQTLNPLKSYPQHKN